MLRAALDRLVRLVASGEVNYFYAQDQFKGLRQDCVVQHVRGALAAAVYEAHARAALEYGDVAEYNQCQGQLEPLYAEGGGAEGGAQREFLAYRVLYQAVHARHGEVLQLLNTLRRVGQGGADAAHPAVTHALAVRAAAAGEDYARFFRLYAAAPGLGRALMDLAVPRVRFAALTTAVKAFKPSLPVPFLASLLGFVRGREGADGVEAAVHAEAGDAVVEGRGWGRGGQPLPGCAHAVFVGRYAAKVRPSALLLLLCLDVAAFAPDTCLIESLSVLRAG